MVIPNSGNSYSKLFVVENISVRCEQFSHPALQNMLNKNVKFMDHGLFMFIHFDYI